MYWGPSYEEYEYGSTEYEYGRTQYEAFQKLSPPSVLVLAAGNGGEAPLNPHTVNASRKYDAIVVGSLEPEGKKSSISQQGAEVFITAPSGEDQISMDQNGNLRRLGGTSGAAPLVTSSLAGFEWLSGYHPTAEESKILLEKTAIPTPHSHDVPQLNGVGMVNAYKLGEVAKFLKQECKTDVDCFKRMIRNPNTYYIADDHGLEDAVEEAFPECSQTCGENTATCANKDEIFKRLRKAAFSHPDSDHKTLWRLMACIYGSGGLTRNAEGAISTYKATFGPPSNGKEAHTICTTDADCVLSACNPATGNSSTEKLWAMTKAEQEIQYALGKCDRAQCNGKCRCGNEEEIVITDGSGGGTKTTFMAKCVQSSCNHDPVITTTPAEETTEDEESELMVQPFPQSEQEGGTGVK